MLMRSVEPDNSSPAISPTVGPGRRGVLAAAFGLALIGGLSACTDPVITAPQEPLSADELAVNRTVADAQRLRADALALALTNHHLASLLNRIATGHEAHLRALGAEVPSATATTPSATTSPSPGGSATPTPTPTPSALVKAEWSAARTALRDGLAATPAFAVLLCRIAAARATDADLIATGLNHPLQGRLTAAKPLPTATGSASPGTTPSPTDTALSNTTGSGDTAVPDASAPVGDTTPTTSGDTTGSGDTTAPDGSTPLTAPSTPATIAINRLLAGQHAAVYAYPLIMARVSRSRRAQASTLWQEHRVDRDLLTDRLIADGVQPAAAEAAYELGTTPITATRAIALAAKIERGLAALAADVIADATDDDRALGADQLVLAARRTALWTTKPPALPGLTPTSPTPTPSTPTTTPS